MEGWVTKPISDVICKTKTVDPRKSPEDKFLYVDVSGVSNQILEITESTQLLGKDAPSRARRVITEGDIIFATIRPTLRRIAVVPNHLDGEVCSTGYFVFQPKPDLHNRFLYYFLQSDYFMNEMEKLQKGASYPAVNDTQIKATLISYPKISEQKRIVALLDKVFSDLEKNRAKTEQNLKNARELFDSYLQQVFSQKGDGWIDLPLGNVCNFKHGFAFKSEFFVDKSDFVLLTPGNFYEDGGYRDRENKTKYYDGDFPEEYLLSKGDLLVAMTEQTAGLLGSSVLVPENNTFLHNQRLGLVEIKAEFENKVSLNFLFHLFNTQYFRAKVQETASGLKVRHTSPKKMQIISIPLLIDLVEQEDIAQKLFKLKARVVELEAIYQQKLDSIDELKKSILQKAFNGELTQD